MTSVKRPEPPLDILEAWGQRGVLVDAPGEAERYRAQVIGSMARLIGEEKKRRERRRRWMWSLGAAAAVVLASAAVLLRPAGQVAERPIAAAAVPAGSLQVTTGVVVALRGGQPVTVAPGAAYTLSPKDELRTGAGAGAVLSLPRGVRVDVAPSTMTMLVESGEVEQRFRLAHGMLGVSVPKPGGPRTFSINTPDAEVVVHGTLFTTRVEQTSSGASRTFVSVSRGAVLVVRGGVETLVKAGQSWASPEPDALPAAEAPTAVAPGPHGAGSGHAAGRSSHASADALAEQNRLFQAALDARAAGDDAAVVRHLDRLLVRFPKTELAREARLIRFRALKRLGRDAEAAREAGRYLLEHPDAPSRGEARDLSSR